MLPVGTILTLSDFVAFYRAHKNSLVFRNIGINDLDWILTQEMKTSRCNYRYMSEKFGEFIKIKHMRDIEGICKLFVGSYQSIPDIFIKIEGYY